MMAAINDLFSCCGVPAKAKIILLGSSDFPQGNQPTMARSLNIEHVSPVRLLRPEISHRIGAAQSNQASILAILRKWFFSRKPDAGFILTDFPATLLQAQVFDEWLDLRDETLSAVILTDSTSSEAVVKHYRTLGLLCEADELLNAS